ncbi:MAG TPA: hypothetical protein VF542_02035, partial [Jatrophihabitans sp.]
MTIHKPALDSARVYLEKLGQGILSYLTIVKCRRDVESGFGCQPVAEVVLTLADVFGKGVAAVKSFVGKQAAAGDEVGHLVGGAEPAHGAAAEGDRCRHFQAQAGGADVFTSGSPGRVHCYLC